MIPMELGSLSLNITNFRLKYTHKFDDSAQAEIEAQQNRNGNNEQTCVCVQINRLYAS